jgi:hypothetical protein
MRAKRVAAVLLAITVAQVAPSAARGQAPGLPDVASGHRPGPDALYGPQADAPQLQNAAPWTAPPILVSGAQAYRGGEWIYQDFLYDDHGGAGTPDDNSPFGPNAFLFSPVAGTFTYPTAPVYANNAADLVELRVRPLADATAFRVTLNTLKDAGRTAFTIALGTSGASHPWPSGAGVSSPAQAFLTVHGGAAELVDAATGRPASPAPTATTDTERRQVDVRVPHAAWDPGRGKVRVTIGVGLWDPKAGSYLAPRPGSATADTPGGASPSGAAIVNVGPRFDEPMPDVRQVPTLTIADSAAGAAAQAAWWRERAQADALRTGDVSGFSAAVDFAKLAAGTEDDSGVPKTGPISRILASRHQFGQGMDPTKVCFDLAANFSEGAKCVGRYVGQLQPYSLYVPKKSQPSGGWGLTLLLHSLSANYNQYTSSRNQSQLGERGPGSLVVTPAGRGPDGFYAGIAEADTFETWADVARHYELDPGWTAVTGYSMGGFGTYRLLARWPDLFARGMSTVGIPGSAGDQLASLRNTPIMAWNADADELVNIQSSEQAVKDLTNAGLRFTEWLYTASDHLTLATNDEYSPAAAYLGTHRVDRSPPHVTYVVDPTEDSTSAQAVGDHAYWVSGLAVRDAKKAKTGTFDARSAAFGVGDAKPLAVQQGGGALDGGTHGPMPYVSRAQDWGPAPRAAKADRLDVRATNISTATVDTARAGLSCAPQLDVQSDGPLDLRLDCPAMARTASRCSGSVAIALPRVRGRRVVLVTVTRRGRRLARVRGRDVRRVTIRRVSSKAFSVVIHLQTGARGAKARRVVVARRIGACGTGR